MALRVLIADDHALLRKGVRATLERDGDVEVVGEACDGREAVRLAAALQPDIVMMDLSMPDLNGIEATRRIADETPTARVIALSMHTENAFVHEAILAGASGYLLKDATGEELLSAVRAVAAGESRFAPQVAEAAAVIPGPGKRGTTPLSSREREVLQLFSEGHGTKEIAFRLGLSAKTIEAHRKNIARKLGLGSIAEMTRYAIRRGLSPL